MEQITYTEFKKLTAEKIIKKLPFEVISDSSPAFRVVPPGWKDPVFYQMYGAK